MQDTIGVARAGVQLTPIGLGPTHVAVRARAPEDVRRGLRFALAWIVAGVGVTVVVWRLGYVAALPTLTTAVGSAAAYALGAGAAPRRGAVPLLALVGAGMLASFAAVVASDAWEASALLAAPGPLSRGGFVSQVLADPDVLSSYVGDLALSAALAVSAVLVVLAGLAVLRHVLRKR